MRALFVLPYPIEGPSSRFRAYQYFPYLAGYGVECVASPFLSSSYYKAIHWRRSRIATPLGMFLGALQRIRDVLRGSAYDVVFINQGTLPFGWPLFERVMRRRGVRIVLDVDDALFLWRGRHRARWLAESMRLSTHVIAGNAFLSSYAREHATSVSVIPSVVDTDAYPPRRHCEEKTVVVGWIGSRTTVRYLKIVLPTLEWLTESHRAVVRVVGGGAVGDRSKRVETVAWDLSLEKSELARFDIGIMPLADEDLARGKCGVKALQYMAAGIPVVSSPVGVATEMIEDGQNGFLAATELEWRTKLVALVHDAALRQEIGGRGRATVERDYSLRRWAPELLSVLRNVAKSRQE